MQTVWDHIIVGAGSAGCVLANRLSADPAVRVLLLEAGGSDRHPFIRMPSALSIPMNSKRWDWGYHSEPEPGLAGRRLHCPRGRLLGGSSSINGMVCVRGHPGDFDGWAAAGATGWDWASVLPYFRRLENFAQAAPEDPWRGRDGPLGTRRGDLANPLYRAFIAAGGEAGYPLSDDLNGAQQEGFGALDMTVAGGERMSASRAWLAPARGRANLAVRTGCTVHRLLLDNGRVTGVLLADGSTLSARRSVLLCAGAINSPQLLLLSGIGPADHLQHMGLPVQHHLPGVGGNLMDHLEVYLQQACTAPVSLYPLLAPWRKALIGLRWLLRRDGLGATNHFEAGGFIRSGAGVPWPDIQFHFLPVAMRYDGRSHLRQHGFQAHVGPMLPASRGTLRLASADPGTAPLLRFNHLSAEADRAVFRACIRLTREIFAQPAMDRYRGAELAPGAAVQDDAALDAWVAEHAESAYHPCGTCRMGAADDPQAVVDPACQVRGLAGLRVVDASVFPRITNGNLNLPTLMLAERAADLIAGRTPLAPLSPPVWQDREWQERQRPGQARRPVAG